ncbi:uncharacterized protein LOC6735519 [Drosophila simulans]|uniref:GD25213 n=1 Tax=Drosophila simulans TaxID=7240 RepID=B4QG04_DROSI|nr:uncharacterized protein LOC6735519 [Drosophila simulans]EDX08040.1 GD25213 [Drosophila simulans]KMY95489.1 uncharacterized protein Dsimw501_GD25213 [Drosophila simulans]
METTARLQQLKPQQSVMSHVTVTESDAEFAILNLDCTEGLESSVTKILVAIEEMFCSYFEDLKKELELQRMAALTLNQLTQRYRINTKVDTSCTCPQIYEIESDDAIINKYYIYYQVIACSNNNQGWVIHNMRPYILLFRRECAKLDLSEDSPFIMGDAFHKPIKFFIDLVEELFAYFYSGHVQFDCAAHMLDPLDLNSIEYYQKLLEPNEDFADYFKYNMSFCKCLRMPRRCPAHEYPQVKEDFNATFVNQAKKKRCARRCEKMAETENNLLDRKKSIVRLQRPSEMSGISTGMETELDNERELKKSISKHQRRSERSIISITKENYHIPFPDDRHELTVKDSVIRWSRNPQFLNMDVS